MAVRPTICSPTGVLFLPSLWDFSVLVLMCVTISGSRPVLGCLSIVIKVRSSPQRFLPGRSGCPVHRQCAGIGQTPWHPG